MAQPDLFALISQVREMVKQVGKDDAPTAFNEKKWKELDIWEDGEKPLLSDLQSLEEARRVDIDDDLLRRFLVARNLNVQKASRMLIDAQGWRIKNAVKVFMAASTELTSAEYPPADPEEEVYRALCPHAVIGKCKENRPIYWEKTGLIRVHKLLHHLTPKKLVKRHVRHMEYLTHLMRKNAASQVKGIIRNKCGIADEQIASLIVALATPDYLKQVVVMDLEGLSYAPDSQGISIFRSCMKIDQNFYPERLGVCFIINAPWLFTGVWAMVRHFLDPKTQRKFRIIGTSYQDELKKVIDADNILECYGGNLKAPGTFTVYNEKEKAEILSSFAESKGSLAKDEKDKR